MDLGPVARLVVESFGEPGRRTFRVYAETPDGSVSLWLEKEQLVRLAAAIEQLLERVTSPRGSEPQAGARSTIVGDLEVKAGTLAVGFDPSRDAFTITGSDFFTDIALESVTLLASRRQLNEIGEQAEEIASAGRPRCVLCGTPLTGEPHFCPQSNGHSHIDLDEIDDEE